MAQLDRLGLPILEVPNLMAYKIPDLTASEMTLEMGSELREGLW